MQFNIPWQRIQVKSIKLRQSILFNKIKLYSSCFGILRFKCFKFQNETWEWLTLQTDYHLIIVYEYTKENFQTQSQSLITKEIRQKYVEQTISTGYSPIWYSPFVDTRYSYKAHVPTRSSNKIGAHSCSIHWLFIRTFQNLYYIHKILIIFLMLRGFFVEKLVFRVSVVVWVIAL